MTYNERIAEKKARRRAMYNPTATDILGCCQGAATPVKVPYDYRYDGGVAPQEKQEPNMNTYVNASMKMPDPVAETRDYFLNRLNGVRFEKGEDLRRKFGLEDDKSPRSPKEVIDRITAGKYVLPKTDSDDECDDYYYRPWELIQWRDPSVKKDNDGFHVAKLALDKLADDTRDKLYAAKDVNYLSILEAFKSATIN